MGLLSDLFGGKPKAEPAKAASVDRFSICVNFVLLREGGYCDHPSDPGGATNKGVTLKVLEQWRGKPCTKADVASLSIPEAEAIYRANYWNKIQGDKLPPGLDLAVFDAAVNSGPGQAAKWLQRAANCTPDGAIGPATLAAVAKTDAVILAHKVCDLRLEFMQSLKTWPVFGKGWARRVKEVEATFL